MRTKVLILTGYYIPGVKGGGPIQSIKNMVDNLCSNIDFYIITSDRDLGDNKPYSSAKIDTWVQVNNAKVYYTNSSKLNARKLIKIINTINFDVIYLNSFFSYKFSVLPILLTKLGKIPSKPIILAPRGEFSTGALKLKSIKKKLFINFAKLIKLYKGIKWHATAESEKKDIQNIFTKQVDIKVAKNLISNSNNFIYDKKIEKRKNELKIAFISRINRKKNLKKAIEFLNYTNGIVKLNIFGPIEDDTYWSECLKEIEKLPKEVEVLYKGTLEHEKVMDMFKSHHIFLFPTLGENFGHVIFEALIGGCPVIISDQTPWRNLEKFMAGQVINLKNEKKFISSIQEYIDMDHEEYCKRSYNAFQYAKKYSVRNQDINDLIELFEIKNKFY